MSLVVLALVPGREGELRSMVDEGKDIDITCDYCGQAYVLTIPELRALLRD